MNTSQQPFESQGPNEAPQLQRRMMALRLGVDEWTHFEPAMIDELQRHCLACESRQRCAHDLATHSNDPDWRDWRDYCPNVAKLSMLSALQTYMQSNLTLEQAVEHLAEQPQTALVETD